MTLLKIPKRPDLAFPKMLVIAGPLIAAEGLFFSLITGDPYQATLAIPTGSFIMSLGIWAIDKAYVMYLKALLRQLPKTERETMTTEKLRILEDKAELGAIICEQQQQ